MSVLYTSARDYLDPLTNTLPVDQAMRELLPKSAGGAGFYREALDRVIDLTADQPLLRAAAHIYCDDLAGAHEIVQDMEGMEAAYIHGIIHRREGDFWNANYWFRRADFLPQVLLTNPVALTADYEDRGALNPDDLIKRTQDEWVSLVNYLADHITA